MKVPNEGIEGEDKEDKPPEVVVLVVEMKLTQLQSLVPEQARSAVRKTAMNITAQAEVHEVTKVLSIKVHIIAFISTY